MVSTSLPAIIMLCSIVMCTVSLTEGRYLPTRSQDDRLDKLRELLRDLLESEIKRSSSVECVPQMVELTSDDVNADDSRNLQQFVRDANVMQGRRRYFKRNFGYSIDK